MLTNLFLFVTNGMFDQVAGSSKFRRQGADLHSDIEITIAQAALGGTMRVQGINDELLITVSGQAWHLVEVELCGFEHMFIVIRW